jgi:hypothetical protein
MEVSKLNGFSLEIFDEFGQISKVPHSLSNYYAMQHNTEYKLKLSNTHNANVDAHVSIDGESVGIWRLDPHGKVTIERPSNVARKFTLLREGTVDAVKGGIVTGSNDNGVVKVTFKPEFESIVHWFDDPLIRTKNSLSYTNNDYGTMNLQSSNYFDNAGTTLGNRSNQQFNKVEPLKEIDQSNVTTIYARLIVDKYGYVEPKFVSLKNASKISELTTSKPPRLNVPFHRSSDNMFEYKPINKNKERYYC